MEAYGCPQIIIGMIVMSHDGRKVIEIKDKTYLRLLECKRVPSESFDSVINRILNGDVDDHK